jgi:enoyl-CoA hydratase
MHPYELGSRKAKEWLFTAGYITANEALTRGMVNRVVPIESLEAAVLTLATQIAKQPTFALKLIKEACNHAQDLQGRRAASQHAFALHHLAHAHNQLKFGVHADPSGMPAGIRDKFRKRMNLTGDDAEA